MRTPKLWGRSGEDSEMQPGRTGKHHNPRLAREIHTFSKRVVFPGPFNLKL